MNSQTQNQQYVGDSEGQAVTSYNYVGRAMRTAPKNQGALVVDAYMAAYLRQVSTDVVALGGVINQFKRELFYHTQDSGQNAYVRTYGAMAALGVENTLPYRTPVTLTTDKLRLLHGLLGKASELAELFEAVTPHVLSDRPLDKVNVMEEVADSCWYDALLLDTIGVTMNQALETNIDKLKKRYPEKFTSENATTRDLLAERRVLERNIDSTIVPKDSGPCHETDACGSPN